MESWARVDVPPDHGVLLSYPHLNLTGGRDKCDTRKVKLTVYRVIDSTGRWETLFDCKSWTRPMPWSFRDTSALLVHFVSQTSDQMTGFRLYFTFHNYSAFPERLENRLWNCSVPYWPDFRRHEPCDLEIDCDQAQDEVDCPYTTDVCGVGFIDAGGSCFQYVIPQVQDTTWNDLDYQCRQNGGRLASLNTPEKWKRITEYLESRVYLKLFDRVMVGLHSASLSLPKM
nr:hypothetical protein BaRGS_016326 [Batillaria attramentaria]